MSSFQLTVRRELSVDGTLERIVNDGTGETLWEALEKDEAGRSSRVMLGGLIEVTRGHDPFFGNAKEIVVASKGEAALLAQSKMLLEDGRLLKEWKSHRPTINLRRTYALSAAGTLDAVAYYENGGGRRRRTRTATRQRARARPTRRRPWGG